MPRHQSEKRAKIPVCTAVQMRWVQLGAVGCSRVQLGPDASGAVGFRCIGCSWVQMH